MEVIVFALLAAYLFFRLWNVLGTRTGQEKQRFDFINTPENTEKDNIIILPPRPMNTEAEGPEIPPALQEKITNLQGLDTRFEPTRFITAAQRILDKVIIAFARGDLDTLRKFVAPHVYEIYERSIAQRLSKNQKREATVENIHSRIVDVDVLADGNASIQVEFISSQCITTLEADGTSFDNPSKLTVTIRDTWTFTRSLTAADPVWYVSATKSEPA
jgi:predicted lipid-binding transport protein (Tim44 family)